MGKAADTREKIFLTAVDCIAERGYANTTVNDIADRIGIKAASLYYHYENKDALLAEILDYFVYHFNQYRTPVEKIVETARAAPLRDAFALMFHHYGDDAEYALMTKIARIIFDLKYEQDAAKKIFQRCFIDGARDYIERALRALTDEGLLEIRDPEPLAEQMVAFSLLNQERTLLTDRPRKEETRAFQAGVAYLAGSY